jgi:hypothetical protein
VPPFVVPPPLVPVVRQALAVPLPLFAVPLPLFAVPLPLFAVQPLLVAVSSAVQCK